MRSQPGELQLQLQRLVMSVAAALDADAAFIALWTLDGTTLPLPSIDSHLAASCGQGPQVFQELEGQLSHSSYSLEGTPLRLEGVVMGSAYAESGWAVPIGRGDHYFGVLYARHRATVGFPARDVLLLKTVAEAAETALDAALAADHAKSQEERIHALLDVAKEISTLGGLDRALGLICRKASELASAEIAYVALADIAQKEIRMRTTLGIANPEWNTMRMAFGEGIGGLVAQQREAVIVRDYESYQHQTRADIREMAGMEGLRAVLAVPMITGHRVLGVLFIADRQPARFTDTDARLLQGLADQAAIAIANSRLYEQERRELEVHDRLSSIVLRNGDYATMVDALHGLVGNPVALYDSHFNLLGCYPASLAPDLKAEVERMRMLVLTERGDLRHDLSADTRLKNQAFMLPTPEDHESALPCAIAPAASGDRVMGYVQVIELDRYLQDQDLRVAERAAVILALRMMTERVEAEVEQRLRGDLLIDILSENIDNVDNAVARFSHLGYDFNLPHIAVVFDAKEERRSPSRKTNNSQDSLVLVKNSLLQKIKSSLEREGIEALVALKSNRVVALIQCPIDPAQRVAFTHRIDRLLSETVATCQLPMTGVVGSGTIVERALDLRRSYEEAVVCVRAAASPDSTSQLVSYYELGIVGILLDSADSGRLTSLVQGRLGALLEYDSNHRSELVSTLTCYLDASCNKAEAAQRLNIHLSTFKYRLRRIEELSGTDFGDPRVRLETHLACHALKAKALFR